MKKNEKNEKIEKMKKLKKERIEVKERIEERLFHSPGMNDDIIGTRITPVIIMHIIIMIFFL